jgi:acetylglutamate kinase
MAPLVLKLGGELLETPEDRARIAALAASIGDSRPLVVVHGGGRSIDVELGRRGIAPRKVDGLRITDAETLDVVVSVLAGSANTALVAALIAAGVRAVGLTGVDAGLGRAARVADYRSTSGASVDLGYVGDPVDADASLVSLLLRHGYVPVIASLGTDDGQVLNVNADAMACRIAAALPGSDLVIAGTTPGVLDGAGQPLARLDVEGIDAAIASGIATAGMVAKLAACRAALAQGVATIRLVDGRSAASAASLAAARGTVLETGEMETQKVYSR